MDLLVEKYIVYNIIQEAIKLKKAIKEMDTDHSGTYIIFYLEYQLMNL